MLSYHQIDDHFRFNFPIPPSSRNTTLTPDLVKDTHKRKEFKMALCGDINNYCNNKQNSSLYFTDYFLYHGVAKLRRQFIRPAASLRQKLAKM